MDESRQARPKMELVKNVISSDERDASSVASGVNAANMALPKGMTPGALLDGKYLLGRVVGSGAFGLVFEGKNLELDEKVAIKTLRPEIAVEPVMVSRFAREAKSAASLKSEYVCSVYDVGTNREGVPYIVMEYLEGRDLATILAESGTFGPRTAVEYALQVCEALAVAHAKGIVHRDIKPENLLLTERAGGMRILKVLDFGISKAALTGSIFGDELPIVKTLNLIGTPLYMSPEQVRSSSGVDVRSDIWSVGMVLYEILAGATAFDGASITEICAAILELNPKPIEVYRTDLPAGLVDVIKRCLEKSVEKRYQNVAELALALMPFGPKRSRLNVERAITILQSVGQVDKAIQLDSAAPPSSMDATGRVTIPRASNVPNIVIGTEEGARADSGAPTVDNPTQSDGAPLTSSRRRKTMVLAVFAMIFGLAGGAVFLRGALKDKEPTAHAAPAPTASSASAITTEAPAAIPTASTAAATMAVDPPTPPTPKVAAPSFVAQRPSTAGAGAVRPNINPNNNTNTATKTSAAASTVATAAASPSAPPTPPPTSNPSKGRTFRREL